MPSTTTRAAAYAPERPETASASPSHAQSDSGTTVPCRQVARESACGRRKNSATLPERRGNASPPRHAETDPNARDLPSADDGTADKDWPAPPDQAGDTGSTPNRDFPCGEFLG